MLTAIFWYVYRECKSLSIAFKVFNEFNRVFWNQLAMHIAMHLVYPDFVSGNREPIGFKILKSDQTILDALVWAED